MDCPNCENARSSTGDVPTIRKVWVMVPDATSIPETMPESCWLDLPYRPDIILSDGQSPSFRPLMIRTACPNPRCWFGRQIKWHSPHAVERPCIPVWERCSIRCNDGFLVVSLCQGLPMIRNVESVPYRLLAGV